MPTKKTAGTDAATEQLDSATAQATEKPTEQLDPATAQQPDAQPTEKLDPAASPFEGFTEAPAPIASAAHSPEHRSMRGTAIAWGIIILLIAAIAWFTSTVDVWQADSRTIVTSIVLVGAVLVGIGILGAIVRAVTRR